MTVTISRLYDNHDDAQQAVRRLESAGVPHSDISLVANNSDSWFNTEKKVDREHDGVDDRAEGAATGGIVGALTEAGVSDEDAHSYAEGVRRGGTLVSARVPDADRSRLDSVLNESAINLRDRSAAWQKAGWKSFDPASKPYGAEEVRKERQLYGGTLR